MKIIICFPPLNSEKGCPTLGQNRQFQYFKEPTLIYPVVPAIAATLLKQNGFDVVWLDCLAQNITQEDFFAMVKEQTPDIIAFETKAPVIKKEWEIVNRLKKENPKLLTAFFGDHVTALPQESFEHSGIDYVLTGGDYDFLLLNLCKHLQDPQGISLEGGIWMRKGEAAESTGDFTLEHNLDMLPFIDRDLTCWKDYAYKNGNYRRTPGTYIMSGRDCWWGKCTFCSWPQLYPKFRARSVKNVLDEIQHLVETFHVREIMDDTGTFSVGAWLKEFCEGMIERGLNKKVTLDCNMRFGAVDFEGYKLMRKAGFRFLLFGVESANQATLDRIKKDLTVEVIKKSCKEAREAGLYPHITIMFGYPWETLEEANNTFDLGAWLLKKGYAYTMQSTVVIPYPRTPLFVECEEKGWLTTGSWDDFDMKRPVMKLGFSESEIPKLVQKLYRVSFSLEFIFRKILSIREIDDIKYFWRAFLKVIGHILDFKRNKPKKRL
ncbi:MAG: radical SAM protein [Candidatus Aceula meridiana]|nr:radical SAM protein [Candidatus Aceula meridiana]